MRNYPFSLISMISNSIRAFLIVGALIWCNFVWASETEFYVNPITCNSEGLGPDAETWNAPVTTVKYTRVYPFWEGYECSPAPIRGDNLAVLLQVAAGALFCTDKNSIVRNELVTIWKTWVSLWTHKYSTDSRSNAEQFFEFVTQRITGDLVVDVANTLYESWLVEMWMRCALKSKSEQASEVELAVLVDSCQRASELLEESREICKEMANRTCEAKDYNNDRLGILHCLSVAISSGIDSPQIERVVDIWQAWWYSVDAPVLCDQRSNNQKFAAYVDDRIRGEIETTLQISSFEYELSYIAKQVLLMKAVIHDKEPASANMQAGILVIELLNDQRDISTQVR